MNKPSERIVVFVTTAQKRAIAATAENLGISVSELMRRAVLSFGATSEQVKAASIVDRLRAPRAPDALDAALQRVARGTRNARAALPEALQTHGDNESAAPAESAAASNADELLGTAAGAGPAPLLPAGVLAALTATAEELEAAAAAEAVARVAAAEAASIAGSAQKPNDVDTPLRNVLKRPRLDAKRDEDDPQSDPSTEGGRFA
ncbi:hypothetical protein R69658_06114 [Paraburkholderia aspalathi]|jgi:hypothetical protein|uniref:Ribbon-helix-helix protein, copG family n=1 Tax=Paraburkholderia aspalathi TaxID=1324617 RepID=A0A1I7EN80_9BURK|nr:MULTISPECIES: hypothetical protein [Paraburkholderia]MBK3822420.1 hypothetical protein [Paraburkholderia aspalathi]MBK3834253.1 hypothetical protein [Paraburkholderia aspalathi]MBK3843789.1 hypothetical protein [Paraburkholderia aspalathi]MBK3863977.1 hypothetical protein [Paraburkholderia aspalathi]MCX4142670.1 hypothetical protein [Paraburkholderia aspalathi]